MSLNDAVEQWLVGFEPIKVVHEVIEEGLGFVLEAAGNMGGDPAVGGGPEEVIVGKGLGGDDVEEGGGEVFVQGVEEGILVDGIASSDVGKGCSGLHFAKLCGAEKPLGGGVEREDVDHVIGPREMLVQGRDWEALGPFAAGWVAAKSADLATE